MTAPNEPPAHIAQPHIWTTSVNEPSWLQVRTWRVFGAAVYVSRRVIVAISLMAVIAFRSPMMAVGAIFSYLAIIFVHELGHAWIAHRLGYEIFAIHIGLVHGRCEIEPPYSHWDAVLISWGGVVAQLLVAAAVLSASPLLPGTISNYFGPFVLFLGYFNVIVAVGNLAPARGLDGALAWRIFPEMVRRIRGRDTMRDAIKRASKRR